MGTVAGPVEGEVGQALDVPLTSRGEAKGARLHQLDGLRAVAALLVVLHHSLTGGLLERGSGAWWGAVAQWLNEGTRSGVDLFFVLSGVVLVRPFVREGRRLEVGTYVRRRVERLWPAFLAAWVLAGAVVWVIGASPTWWTAKHHHWPAFSAGGWLRQLPIVNFGWESYNAAWWSLGVEVLFYAALIGLIPLLQRARGAVRGLAAGAVVASLGVKMVVVPGMPAVAGELLWYAPCFAMGLVLACGEMRVGVARGLAACGLAWGTAACFVPWMGIHVGWAVMYGGVVGWALARGSGLARGLARPVMVWVGERSYSLFLTHFAVFDLVGWGVSRWMGEGVGFFVVSRVVGYGAALVVAVGVFEGVERWWARGLTTAGRVWPWSS